MQIYLCNLAPRLNPSLKKEHTGYWAVDVPDGLEHYIIFKINQEKNQSQFFFGGGHKNVDRKQVVTYVNKLVANESDLNREKINEILKTKSRLLKNTDEQIYNLTLMKKYHIQQFFN